MQSTHCRGFKSDGTGLPRAWSRKKASCRCRQPPAAARRLTGIQSEARSGTAASSACACSPACLNAVQRLCRKFHCCRAGCSYMHVSKHGRQLSRRPASMQELARTLREATSSMYSCMAASWLLPCIRTRDERARGQPARLYGARRQRATGRGAQAACRTLEPGRGQRKPLAGGQSMAIGPRQPTGGPTALRSCHNGSPAKIQPHARGLADGGQGGPREQHPASTNMAGTYTCACALVQRLRHQPTCQRAEVRGRGDAGGAPSASPRRPTWPCLHAGAQAETGQGQGSVCDRPRMRARLRTPPNPLAALSEDVCSR